MNTQQSLPSLHVSDGLERVLLDQLVVEHFVPEEPHQIRFNLFKIYLHLLASSQPCLSLVTCMMMIYDQYFMILRHQWRHWSRWPPWRSPRYPPWFRWPSWSPPRCYAYPRSRSYASNIHSVHWDRRCLVAVCCLPSNHNQWTVWGYLRRTWPTSNPQPVSSLWCWVRTARRCSYRWGRWIPTYSWSDPTESPTSWWTASPEIGSC